MNVKSEPAIERQILDYFAARPAAQDTLRGIVEWWLLKQRIVEVKSEVEAALGRLVARGKLDAQAGPDGQVCYRLLEAREKKDLVMLGREALRNQGDVELD